MLRRWYNILLPITIFWRWLRVLSTIRLYQANLLVTRPVRAQIKRDLFTNF